MTHQDTTATSLPTGSAQIEHGTIAAVTQGGVIVHSDTGVIAARVAVSCLLEPAAGDVVLLSRSPRASYVLGILERQTSDRRIQAAGALTIAAEDLHLSGTRQTTLDSRGRTSIASPELGFAADSTTLHTADVNVTSDTARADFGSVRLRSETMQVVAGRIVQCAKQVLRRVEDVETLHVGQLVQRVRRNLFCRAHRVNMTSRKDMRIDGERIHMG